MNQNYLSSEPSQLDADPPKMSSGLNVLTILTFIGCGIGILFTLGLPAINDFLLNMMDKAAASGKDFSAKELADMEKGRAAIALYKANMIPLMVSGVLCIILCFLGALWMRKLKKDGYWLYVVGELAPIAVGIVILGTGQYESIMSIVIGMGIPVVFVLLYTMQRKYLVR